MSLYLGISSLFEVVMFGICVGLCVASPTPITIGSTVVVAGATAISFACWLISEARI